MKSCTIYKTFKNEYKIVSQCKTTAGYLLAVTPAYILSTNCSDEELFSAILTALKNSAKKVKAPDRDDFPAIQKILLSDLKEKSFTKLYVNSTSCEIRVEGNSISIYPNKLLTEGNPKDGLYWVEEDKVVIQENTANVDTLVLKVKEILNRKYY
jgi:hypothetical protein